MKLSTMIVSVFLFVVIPLKAKDVTCRMEMEHAVLPAGMNQRSVLKVTLDAPPPPNDAKRPPVNLSIVLDRSGSMSGMKLQYAKQAAIQAVRRLSRGDWVSLIIYNHEIKTVVPAQPVSQMDEIERRIQAITATGDTALFGGVSQGASEIRKNLNRGYIHRVILLSDGMANVGPSLPSDLGRLGVALMKEGIAVTTIGLGDYYNEDLMTQLSQQSDGNTYYVKESMDLPVIFQKELGDVFSVVAKKVTITIECPVGVKPIATIGREGRISGQKVEITLNQLYGNQEKYVLVEVEIEKALPEETRKLAAASVHYLDVVTGTEKTSSGQVSAVFSDSKEEVVASSNQAVQRAAYLNYSAIAQEKCIALADKGQVEEAVQTLRSSIQQLNEKGLKNKDEALLKKAEEMDQMAMQIKKNKKLTKEGRKVLKTESYQLRNQQKASSKK